MQFIQRFATILALATMLVPEPLLARGGGGRAGGGGGGMARPAGGGGGGARPAMGGGGGVSRPNMGGAQNHSPSFSHPTGGGSARPQISGGSRPNIGSGNFGNAGGNANRPTTLPGSANRPNLGNGNRPTTLPGNTERPNLSGGNFGNGNRPNLGGENRPTTLPAVNERPNLGGGQGIANRPNIGGNGNRPTTLPGNINRPNGGGNLDLANRPNLGGNGNRPTTLPANINRPNIGGGNVNINNRPNFGGGNVNINNRPNIGNGNNFTNINNNNIHIATNRPYYNNWHHGNWNGNWNRPGGSGYWNGYAHGYTHGYWNGGWGGYWHGGWGGGYWGRPWYASPIAWGLGTWAVGSIIYNSGYISYSNPYYVTPVASSPVYYDYSQPITVINQQPSNYSSTDNTEAIGDPATDLAAAPVPEVQQGTSHLDVAREAFKNGDYATAMSETNEALKSLPNDAPLHEFRALVQFASQDYAGAAATLYAVLSAGPGWDWTTLSGMYPNSAVYTDQLRQLEAFVKSNPNSAEAHFVLAYHYLSCGHNDAAIKQYQAVAMLQPADQLTVQLLKMLGSDATATATAAIDQPTPELNEEEAQPIAPAAIDSNKLVGIWTATRSNGPKFSLNLTSDSKFKWAYDQGTQHQEFAGKYSVDGPVLVLQREDGAQMPGLVTLADNGFNFKLYGGPPDDTGLDFTK